MIPNASPVLIRLALLAVACRALVPVGYMPAALSDGGPVKVCHGGLAGAFFAALAEQRATTGSHAGHGEGAEHGHAHSPGSHGDQAPAGHEAWEHCPVGTVFAHAALTSDIAITIASPAQSFEPIAPTRTHQTVFTGSYRARAPPPA